MPVIARKGPLGGGGMAPMAKTPPPAIRKRKPQWWFWPGLIQTTKAGKTTSNWRPPWAGRAAGGQREHRRGLMERLDPSDVAAKRRCEQRAQRVRRRGSERGVEFATAPQHRRGLVHGVD